MRGWLRLSEEPSDQAWARVAEGFALEKVAVLQNGRMRSRKRPLLQFDQNERIEIASRLIAIIKKFAIQGLAITVNKAEFDEVMLTQPIVSSVYDSAYAFCAHTILAGVSCWIDANPLVNNMSYFFEAGHSSESTANKIMNTLFQQPQNNVAFRYGGHEFVQKEKCPQVQAADLLAWQWYKDRKNELEKRPRRKDCESLLQLHHNAIYLNREKLQRMLFSVSLKQALQEY